jgi:hypothetical protein
MKRERVTSAISRARLAASEYVVRENGASPPSWWQDAHLAYMIWGDVSRKSRRGAEA